MSKETMLAAKVWAVIGANQNPEKFGNIIYRRLKSLGYTVYAVNPHCDTVEGDICYPNLSALPAVPEVIDMVASPSIGLPIVKEAAQLGVHSVWFQPGTHDDMLITEATSLGLEAVTGCVLVETKGRVLFTESIK